MMSMRLVDVLNITGLAVAAVVMFATIRLGIRQARLFRRLTGDTSALVSVLSLSRAQASWHGADNYKHARPDNRLSSPDTAPETDTTFKVLMPAE